MTLCLSGGISDKACVASFAACAGGKQQQESQGATGADNDVEAQGLSDGQVVSQ
jgi:hypothetical protein